MGSRPDSGGAAAAQHHRRSAPEPAVPAMVDPVNERAALPLQDHVERFVSQFDHALEQALASNGAVPPLSVAMRAAVLGGGKRFRPLLVDCGCALFDIPGHAAQRVGICVEFLHAASLVLDDLPVMDNAETRRGTAPVHLVFGEAQAILVATALISLAFQTLAEPGTWPDAEIRTRLVTACARAIGPTGISGGQSLDLVGAPGEAHKTADLIRFCCEVGPILGQASPAVHRRFSEFGAAIGLAFQERDDLLDGEGHRSDSGTGVGLKRSGVRAGELARSLTTDFGFPKERVIPLAYLAEWTLRSHCCPGI